MSADYLEISYTNELVILSKENDENCVNLPFSNSRLFKARIIRHLELTSGEDVKKVYDVSIDKADVNFDFHPGDAIGILPLNTPEEVDGLMDRLDMNDVGYSLKIREDTTKKKATIPGHIPQNGRVRLLFEQYLDIRCVPKKAFLKMLSQHATDEGEKNELLLLSSPRSEKYTEFISNDGKTLLTLLRRFHSCCVPLERLLEHLPSLKPRFYSISSSKNCKELHITFSLVDFNENLKGVCTSYLERLLHSSENDQIRFYFRTPSCFLTFESDFTSPLILIGTGTGLAPFIGFLKEIESTRNKFNFSQVILFFGCRYSNGDFIYKSELHSFKDLGVVTALHTAFSRETNEKVYVPHKIREYDKEIANLLLNQNAHVRLCGDAKNLQKGVDNALTEVLIKQGEFDKSQANDFLKDLKKSGRYQLDIWL